MLGALVTLAIAAQPSRKVEQRMAQTVSQAAGGPSVLEFAGASERWNCKYKTESGNPVTSKYGLFRTRISDEFDEEFSIVQNDDHALVGAKSTYGVEDIEGKVTKWYQVILIDKRDRSFRQISEDLSLQRRYERLGRCSPY